MVDFIQENSVRNNDKCCSLSYMAYSYISLIWNSTWSALYYLIILFDHQTMKITDSLRFLRDQNSIMNEALYKNIMAIERVYVSFSMCWLCWLCLHIVGCGLNIFSLFFQRKNSSFFFFVVCVHIWNRKPKQISKYVKTKTKTN